eukprot:338796_1
MTTDLANYSDTRMQSKHAIAFNQIAMKQSISFDRHQRFNIAKYTTKIHSNSGKNEQQKKPNKDENEKEDNDEKKELGNDDRDKYNADKLNESKDDEDDSDDDDSSDEENSDSDEEDSDDTKENKNKVVATYGISKSALDQLFDYMQIQGISIDNINTCASQFFSEEYDTDAFMHDVIKSIDQTAVTQSNCKRMCTTDESYN